MRVAIIGAGRMGRIRALSARRHPRCRVVSVTDALPASAETLAREMAARASGDWRASVEADDVDAVVVATPHKYLAEISAAARHCGKAVFCEKPGARRPTELEPVLETIDGAWRSSTSLRKDSMVVGFTLRHHPAISQAHQLVMDGAIGDLMYVRAHYGHGGRPGYDNEWRGNPEFSGGGELIDQGVHLIDLARWFLGEFSYVSANIGTFFWGKQSPERANIDDNAFLLLQTPSGKVASLHASWTQWKNSFVLEVFGETGSLHVSGLGGYYGDEKLVVVRRRPEGGVPSVDESLVADKATVIDDVWSREWDGFVQSVHPSSNPGESAGSINSASVVDAWQALRIVEAAYHQSSGGTSHLQHGESLEHNLNRMTSVAGALAKGTVSK